MSNSEAAIEFMKMRTKALEAFKKYYDAGIALYRWKQMFDLNEEYWVGE